MSPPPYRSTRGWSGCRLPRQASDPVLRLTGVLPVVAIMSASNAELVSTVGGELQRRVDGSSIEAYDVLSRAHASSPTYAWHNRCFCRRSQEETR